MRDQTRRRLGRMSRAIDSGLPKDLERCREFLRQKSASASGEGILETAALVRGFIDELGGEASFVGDPAFPIVYGRLTGSSARTVIVCGMYDVQPVQDPRWTSPPFADEIRELPGLGECVIARDAVNSKGALCGSSMH